MQISKLRLRNYKGFRDSDWIDLPRGITVVVGQNNSGKTALIESLRLTNLASKPHRSLARDAATPLDPTSLVEIVLNVSGLEFMQCILNYGNQSQIPCPTSAVSGSQPPQSYLDELFNREAIPLKLHARPGGMSSAEYPTLDFEPDQSPNHRSLIVQASEDRLSARVVTVQITAADNIPTLIQTSFANTIYVFKAERLNIGRTTAIEATVLSPDGSNLAAVLMNLQSNPNRFQRFKKHVIEIFPNIKELSVNLVGQDCEVRIWSVETERDDLAIPLQESGTGIGQVLAILYVAQTIKSGLIVIDEPSTFLHPGAAKRLIQILQSYSTNQYILSTHSAELISTAQPDSILLINWLDGESHVEKLNGESLTDLQKVLGEVGVSFSDVFGYDRAIWVEGQTEEICFPLVLKRLNKDFAKGSVFLAVKNTGDFEKKTNQKRLIWDIYSRLSSSIPLLPVAVVFSFDRENRKDSEIQELTKESGGRVRFLPRLCYENYLIVPDAIAAILNEEIGSQSISVDAVRTWIEANGSKHFGGHEWAGDITALDWLAGVNAANLLKELFNEVSGVNSEYRKTTHSVGITEWILDNQPEKLQPLADYISSLSS